MRQILADATKENRLETRALGTRIANRFAAVALSGEIAEWRGAVARPADLGE